MIFLPHIVFVGNYIFLTCVHLNVVLKVLTPKFLKNSRLSMLVLSYVAKRFHFSS